MCEDSNLMEYDTALVDEWVPALRRRLLHPFCTHSFDYYGLEDGGS